MKVNKSKKAKHNAKNKNVSVVSVFPGNRENAKKVEVLKDEVLKVENEAVSVEVEKKEVKELTEQEKKELEMKAQEAENAKNGVYLLNRIDDMLKILEKRRDNQKCKGKIRKNGERVFCHTVWYTNKIKQLEQDRENGIKNGDKWIQIRPLKISGFWSPQKLVDKQEQDTKNLLKEASTTEQENKTA